MTLFLDCDDTLIKWLDNGEVLEGTHPYGGGYERYAVNEALVVAARAWVATNPGEPIIVWSGGGKEYAQHWREVCFLPEDPCFALAKDIRLPTKNDVCVDDQYLKVAGMLMTDAEFVETAQGLYERGGTR